MNVHSINLCYFRKKCIIVSAPHFNRSHKEGAIFTCNPNENNTCNYWNLDSGNKENQRDQRMGFSMSVINDFLLICAPLWHRKANNARLMYLGRCSVLNKSHQFVSNFSVCETENTDSNVYHGYCESGFSTDGIVYNNKYLFYLGAPGSYLSKGVIFAEIQGTKSRLKTSEERLKDYSYMGYSVSSGNFTGNEYGDVVGGAPRANNLKGMVILYSLKFSPSRLELLNIFENPDDQVGAYFGATVCAIDFNNDGKDELLVGSPYYSTFADEGRVYIYTNNKIFKGLDLLDEYLNPDVRAYALFGSTITKIGDLNNDGYNDVAIGAPGGGPDGKGAVYIYNGGVTGIRSTYSQVIYASDFLSSFETGFGSSISKGVDVDGNKYPDIAIGAYNSGKVFFFRSKPVITITDKLMTNVTQVPTDLESSNCLGPNLEKYYCIEFKLDLKYSGISVPQNLLVRVNMEIDSQRSLDKRGYFRDNSSSVFNNNLIQNVTLSKDKNLTISYTTYIAISGKIDIIEPIIFNTKYEVFDNSTDCISGFCSVFDAFSNSGSRTQVSYLIKCNDTECKIDLSLNSSLIINGSPQQNEIIYGVTEMVNVHSKLINFDDTAYQVQLKVKFNSDLELIGIEINGKSNLLRTISIIDGSTMELLFLVSNSLVKLKEIDVVVKFSVHKLTPSSLEYMFELETFAIGIEQNTNNNKVLLKVPTKIETCVLVGGFVSPMTAFFDKDFKAPRNSSLFSDDGQEVMFTFDIENSGFHSINAMVTEIDIVVKKDNIAVIYVEDLRVDSVQCDPIINGLSSNNTNFSPLYQFNSNINLYGEKTQENKFINHEKLDCRSGTCKIYTCNITNLDSKKTAKVYVKAKLFSANLVQLQLPYTRVYTSIEVKFNGIDRERNVQRKDCSLSSIVTFTIQEQTKGQNSIKWWIILLSAVGALLLLAVFTFVLRRAGFFERKRKIKEISGPSQEKNINERANPLAHEQNVVDGDENDDDI
ncbi:integrin alpha-8 isoform X2 [Hydra vulgaris]|uniref:integrin alpha-8 isoform X2 n=1 Tax=Hydra vulgaris TaxID=6087 RepID=UPI001F5E770E|nr:integrin alpha-8-like isoform X2 [Hydra vulgaris]